MHLNTPSLVWLVDDDEDDCDLFKGVADEIGLETERMFDGVQLMKRLRSNLFRLPDYIFLDIYMPLKSGIECLQEIKGDANLKHIPVIMYSNTISPTIIKQLFELGAFQFLEKPDSVGELKQMILDVVSTTGKCVFVFAA